MKNSKKLLALLLVLVMVLGLFAGCKTGGPKETEGTGQTQGGSDPTQPGSDDGPKFGGHLNVRIDSQPNSLDPLKMTGVWRYVWTTSVYEPILTRDVDNNICPSVCTHELSDDNLTLKLKIREGASFSTGEAVELEDVKASIQRSVTLYSGTKNNVGAYLKDMVIEGDTLIVTFTEYHEMIMNYMAGYQTWMAVMPKEICEKYPDTAGFTAIEDAIGTGPYKITDFVPDVSVSMVKRDDYVPVPEGHTGAAAPKMAYMDTVSFIYNSDSGSATTGLLAGDYDMIDDVIREMMETAKKEGIVESVLPSNIGDALYFNTVGSNNICSKYTDLRKAVIAAIDFQAYLDVVTDGQAVTGGCPVLGDKYYTDLFTTVDYYGAQDLDAAARYLAAAKEAGYNDEPVQVVLSNGYEDHAVLLKAYMEAASIPVQVTLLEHNAATEFQNNLENNWDIIFQWPTYTTTPGTMPVAFTMTRYGNSPRKDALVGLLDTTPVSDPKYDEYWAELAQIIVDDCSSVHMGTQPWRWYHPEDLHLGNDEGIEKFTYNAWWENPADHPAK